MDRKKYLRLSTKRNRLIVFREKNRPCADCGIQHPPYVMDFDHVRGEKEFAVSTGARVSGQRLIDEIAKCEVVCSNCHRKRTHARRIAKNAKNKKTNRGTVPLYREPDRFEDVSLFLSAQTPGHGAR